MAQFSDITVGNINGGLNLRASTRNLKPDECTKADNIEIIAEGGFAKVNGCVRLNPLALNTRINGITEYKPPVGRRQIIFAAGKNLYELEPNGDRRKLTSNDVANALTDFTTFNDVLIISNGSDTIRVWDGSNFSTLDGFPGNLPTAGAPRYSRVWKNRLVLWGDATNPFQIYFSATGDHNDFQTANGAFAINVSRGDGEDIKMLYPFRDKLIVHKESSMQAIIGSTAPGSGAADEISIQDLFTEIGSNAPGTVVNLKNDQLFMYNKTIRSLAATDKFGDVETQTVSYKIKPLMDQINTQKLDEAFSLYYPDKDEVWFFFPTLSSGQNNEVLVLNGEVGAWTRRPGLPESACGTIIDGFPVIGTYDGRILRCDFGGDYDGKPIIAECHLFWNTFGVPKKTKRIRSIDVTAQRTGKFAVEVKSAWDYQEPTKEFLVDVSPDDDSALWGVALWGVALWSKTTPVQERQLTNIGWGKVHQLQFRNIYVDQPFEIQAIDMCVEARNMRPAFHRTSYPGLSYVKGSDLLVDEVGDSIISNFGERIRV